VLPGETVGESPHYWRGRCVPLHGPASEDRRATSAGLRSKSTACSHSQGLWCCVSAITVST
jgi:hypothetical protein